MGGGGGGGMETNKPLRVGCTKSNLMFELGLAVLTEYLHLACHHVPIHVCFKKFTEHKSQIGASCTSKSTK